MAITSIGTPVLTQNTGTGSPRAILSTWGTGQSPGGSGDLLVALVTACGSTSAGTITEQTSYGWTKIYESGGTYVKAAIFTKAAGTGTELAPTFQSTIAGTSARCRYNATLYQLHDDVDGTLPVLDTGAQAANGTTSLTLATAGNVAAANEFALAVIAMQAGSSAAANWGTVGSWATLVDGATSYAHFVCARLSNPASGSPLSYNPTHSTSTGLGGSIAVFKPGVQVGNLSGGPRLKKMAVAGSASHNALVTGGPRLKKMGISVSATAASNQVTVTFVMDDGRESQTGLLSVYNSHGVHATLYIASNLVGAHPAPGETFNVMTWAEIDTFAASGHDIANHTADHYAWVGNLAVWQAELAEGSSDIEAQGYPAPDSFSYPIGYWDATAAAAVDAAGMPMAHTGDADLLTPPTGVESMPPAGAGGLGWVTTRMCRNAIPTSATLAADVAFAQGLPGRSWLIYITHEGFSPIDSDLDACLTWCANNGIPVKSVHEVLTAEYVPTGNISGGPRLKKMGVSISGTVSPPGGGWNVIQSNGSGSGAGNRSATYDTPLSSGTKLVAVVGVTANFATSRMPNGVGDGTHAFVPIGNSPLGQTQGNYTPSVSVWVLDTPTALEGTTPTITATMPSGTNENAIVIMEVSGLATGDTAARDGSGNSALQASGASVSQPAYSSTASSEMLLSVAAEGGNGNEVLNSGYTIDEHSVQGGFGVQFQVGRKNSTGGAESGTWTGDDSSNAIAMLVLALKLAPVANPDFDSVGPSNGVAAYVAATSQVQWTHTVLTDGSTLLAAVSLDDADSSGMTTTATCDSTPMTSIGKIPTNDSTVGYLEVFKLDDVDAGAHTITITGPTSPAPDGMAGGSIAVKNTSGLNSTKYTDTGWDVAPKVDDTANTSGNIIVSFAAAGAEFGSTVSPGTLRVKGGKTGGGAGGGDLAGGTWPATGSTVTTEFTVTDDYWSILTVEALGGTAPEQSNVSGGPRLKKMTVAISASHNALISGGPRLKKMRVSVSGTGISSVSAGPRLKKMGVSGSLTKVSSITGGPRLKKMGVAGSLTGTSAISSAPRLKKMGVAIEADAFVSGESDISGGPSLKKMRFSAAVSKNALVSGGPRLKKMGVSASLTGTSAVSGGPRLKKMGVAASVTKNALISGGPKLKKMSVAIEASAFVGEQSDISGGPSLKKMRVSGSASHNALISGGPRLKKMSVSLTGTTTSSVSGGPRLKKLIVSGEMENQGAAVITGGPSLKRMQVHGSAVIISPIQLDNLFIFSPL